MTFFICVQCFFYLRCGFFTCVVAFLFAFSVFFYLRCGFFICGVVFYLRCGFFICAVVFYLRCGFFFALPLWATVLITLLLHGIICYLYVIIISY